MAEMTKAELRAKLREIMQRGIIDDPGNLNTPALARKILDGLNVTRRDIAFLAERLFEIG